MSREKKDTGTKPLLRTGRPGVKRWLYIAHLDLGRLAFTLQRVTGFGLTIYFIVHIFTTGNVLGGEDAWIMILKIVENPQGWTGELILLAAIGFHVVNGLRLLLAEFGYTLPAAKRPDYPYRVRSFNILQKILVVAAFAAALLFFLIGYLFIFLEYRVV